MAGRVNQALIHEINIKTWKMELSDHLWRCLLYEKWCDCVPKTFPLACNLDVPCTMFTCYVSISYSWLRRGNSNFVSIAGASHSSSSDCIPMYHFVSNRWGRFRLDSGGFACMDWHFNWPSSCFLYGKVERTFCTALVLSCSRHVSPISTRKPLHDCRVLSHVSRERRKAVKMSAACCNCTWEFSM